MRRGEIWTAAGGPDYAGKPRPVVVIQDDRFADAQSVTICSLTSNPAGGEEVVRVSVAPTEANGLRAMSRLMVDKITTIPRGKLGRRIGKLAEADMAKLDSAVIIFLRLDR